MIFDLIMAGCVWFTLLFCYLTLRSQTRRQKGLLLGVTLAADAMELPEVQQILARFQKELRLWCLAGAAGCLPMFAVHATWVKLTIWMVWLYAAMLLPYLPYLRAYLALRQVKRRLGGGPVCPTRVTDTAASETALPKPIGLWSLVLPLAVSLVPVFWPGQLTALRLVCLLDAATVVLLWVCGRWMFRRRADMVTNDSARNQTLVRVRRLYWDRFWRLNLWGLAGVNFCIGMFPTSAAAVGGCLLLTAVLLGGCLWMELSVRRIQEKLTAGAEVIADEDDAWLLGMFYYNPADPRMMVAKRLGVGTSMNLATGADRSFCWPAACCWWGVCSSGLGWALWRPCPPGWRSGARPSPPCTGTASSTRSRWRTSPTPSFWIRCPPATGWWAPAWIPIWRGISRYRGKVRPNSVWTPPTRCSCGWRPMGVYTGSPPRPRS